MPKRTNLRSRLKEVGWIFAGAAPLAFFWMICHERTSAQDPYPPRPRAILRGPDVAPRSPVASRASLLLTGEVVDPEGLPVAHVPVRLVDPEGRGDVLAPGRTREIRDLDARTDESGRFRFAGLAPGRRFLIAQPDDRAAACVELALSDPETHHRLELPLPVSLAGLTQSRARLSFVCRIPGMPSTGHRPLERQAVADESGAYRVDGLAPSLAFTVRVEADGYRSRIFGPYQFPSGRQLLDFDLDTGLTLRGTVRDGGGRPVAGARVVFDDARTLSDADGTFLLAGLADRTTTLTTSRDGHIQTVMTAVRPGSIDVTLPRAAEVSGRITGGRARYISFTLGDARYRMGLGDSDTFRIPSVPPGPLRLDVEDAECRVVGTVMVEAPEGGCVEGVEIQLR
ncbi:MAG: carboxypeptidase regulatory-like domain-containing protein [Planctomycetota bacterium]|nr:MAG: carboxypeptidase regulatory-like domain-containing protein [Planctomycetota bacterium]